MENRGGEGPCVLTLPLIPPHHPPHLTHLSHLPLLPMFASVQPPMVAVLATCFPVLPSTPATCLPHCCLPYAVALAPATDRHQWQPWPGAGSSRGVISSALPHCMSHLEQVQSCSATAAMTALTLALAWGRRQLAPGLGWGWSNHLPWASIKYKMSPCPTMGGKKPSF